MFRELMKKNKEISKEECRTLLRNEKRGVLSVLGDEDYPYGMPMNHYYHDEDGCLYFHCGHGGHRLDAIQKHDKASFCVVEQGTPIEGDWALRTRSVIAFGRIELVDDREAVIRMARALSYKFTQDEAYIQKEIDAYASQTLLLRMRIEHLCGKCVTES